MTGAWLASTNPESPDQLRVGSGDLRKMAVIPFHDGITMEAPLFPGYLGMKHLTHRQHPGWISAHLVDGIPLFIDSFDNAGLTLASRPDIEFMQATA